MYRVLAETEGLSYTDWLSFRRLGVGGSDASVVCGVNRWKSPVELWMEKTGQLPDSEAGEPAYWGTVLEAVVKDEFTKRTGIEITPVKQILQSEDHPFMLANLDGTCQHPIYGPCIFEAKTSSAYRSSEWSDAIPDEYVLQVQHYMAVTGHKGAYVAVLIGGNSFRWKFIERDEELISMLVKLEDDFWRHVQEGVPPRRWTAPKRRPTSSMNGSRIAYRCPVSTCQPPLLPCSISMTPPVSSWRRSPSRRRRPKTC